MSAAPALDLVPGSIFARDFRIIGPLAEGGMGVIYLVEQISTSKQRALKVMHPQLVQNPKHRERFAAEAKVSSRIESDHVTEIVGAGVDEGTGIAWLAMELLRGRTLYSVIEQSGPLAPGDALEVSKQLGHVLWQAHGIGLVHRDLKPENIFMAVPRRSDVAFTIKVLDFGISKWVQEARNATQNSQIIGSPYWMAPEQLEHGGLISPATDVWALGLIFFFVLTGKIYWKAGNLEAPSLNSLIVEVILHPIVKASERAAELDLGDCIPKSFDAWFAKCLERDISKRFPSAAECLADLEQLLLAASRLPHRPSAPIKITTGTGGTAPLDGIGIDRSGVAPSGATAAADESVVRGAVRSPGPGSSDLSAVLEEQLAATADPAVKAEIALRIARVFEIHTSERDRAIETYRRVLEFAPTSLEALRGLSSLYRISERWQPLVDVLRAQEGLATNALPLSDLRTVRLEIARVLDERLADPLAAERAWRSAFEANPLDTEVSKSLVAHLCRRQLWAEAAGVLERVLVALSTVAPPLPDQEFETLQSLGTIYRDHLHQPDAAVRYFERASRARPEDHSGQFALAEIYAIAGRPDEAASHWMRVLAGDARSAAAYTSLFDLHQKAGATDRMWCTAAMAFAMFGDATPSGLREVYERGRARAAAAPQGRVADELWDAQVRHGDEDRTVTSVLEIAAGPLRKALVKTPQACGLTERERLDPALSAPGLVRASMPVYRAMLSASATLDVPTVPVLYYRAAQPTALTHVISEPMASLAGGEFLKTASVSTLSFVAARHIAYYRPEYYVRVLAPDAGGLRAVWAASLHAAAGTVPTDPAVGAELARLAFDASALSKLRTAIGTRTATLEKTDLSRWMRAVDLTAVRAAALLCGDPGILRAALAGESCTPSTVDLETALTDVVLFVLSEGYATMRAALGMVRK